MCETRDKKVVGIEARAEKNRRSAIAATVEVDLTTSSYSAGNFRASHQFSNKKKAFQRNLCIYLFVRPKRHLNFNQSSVVQTFTLPLIIPISGYAVTCWNDVATYNMYITAA